MTTRDTCPLVTRRQFLAGIGATAAVSVAGYSVGIWGRNPAVAAAATGHLGSGADRTLVVVENEGNAGLSTATPPVHQGRSKCDPITMSARPSRFTSPKQTPQAVSSPVSLYSNTKFACDFGTSPNRPLPSLTNKRLPCCRPPAKRSGQPSPFTSPAATPNPVSLSGSPTFDVTSSNFSPPRLRYNRVRLCPP